MLPSALIGRCWHLGHASARGLCSGGSSCMVDPVGAPVVSRPAAAADSAPSSIPGSSSAHHEAAGPELLSGDELLRWRRQLLGAADGGKASSFDWLLDLGAGLSWSDLQALWLHPERQVRLSRSRSQLEGLWHRHLQSQEPLQYLVGLCPWRDFTLRVAPGVLIPRQETELLVDLALDGHADGTPPAQPLLWADLGTGSGCLAMALARAFPCGRGLAVDASAEALRVAAANLVEANLSERVTLVQGDWWQALEPWWQRLQIVVSNPPYIPSSSLPGLDAGVRDHEPALALDGGPDGLDAIRQVLSGACKGLAPGGALLMEHHHDQSAAVQHLMQQAGLTAIKAHQDLEGTWRFASARRPFPPQSEDG